MMEKQNKRQRTTLALLWQLAVVCLLACVILTLFLRHFNAVVYQANTKQNQLMSLGYELQNDSDYLTSQARAFSVSHRARYLKNYWDEVLLKQHRDQVIADIESYSSTAMERQLLMESKRASDDLVNTELHSMKLVLSAYQVPAAILPLPIQQYHLIEKDKVLNDDAKIRLAQSLLFDDDYAKAKAHINQPIETYNRMVSSSVQQDLLSAENKVQITSVLLVLLLSISLVLLLGSLWARGPRSLLTTKDADT